MIVSETGTHFSESSNAARAATKPLLASSERRHSFDHHVARNIRSRFVVATQNQDDLSTTLRNARPAANARQLSTMIWNRRSLR
jgi:hypothetical protein